MPTMFPASPDRADSFAGRLPGFIQQLIGIGVKPGMDPKLAKNILITNFAAYAHVFATFPYYWVLKALGATWLSTNVFPLTLFFLALPQVNRFGFFTASRILLLTVINFHVYVYTASLGMASSVQNVYFFTLVSPLMLFRVTEWRSILFCTAQPLFFWGLLIYKGSWMIPRTHFDGWALEIMSPAISFTTASMLFTCSFLISFLQQRGEIRLERAKEIAESSDRAKSRFIATMSHEIRTPMNGIFGVLQMLLESDLSARQKEDLRLMKSSGDLLLAIINDILDFSKIEAGKLELESRPFHLLETVRICHRMLEKEAMNRGLSLDLIAAHPLPTWVLGDEIRFRQVVMNLAMNALKFTRQGKVSLELSQIASAGAFAEISLYVRDTGIGMAPETLARLFKPFSQADSSTTREFGGTGLGLAISKRLAMALGGDILAETVLGEGSVFHFTARLQITTAPAIQPQENKRAWDAAEYADKTALLVEDNRVNQLIGQKMLERLGFTVTVAGDGQDALAAAAHSHFDVIFMDCQMPRMDGFEATRQLRNLDMPDKRRLIIAITANTHPDDRQKCLDAGMDDFIPKPLLVPDLLASLQRHLPVTS